MRYYLSIMLLLLTSKAGIAQSNLNLSFHTGLLNSSLNFVNTSNVPYDMGNLNILLDLRLWKEYKDHWQVGVSIENGMIKERVDFRTFVFQNNILVTDLNTQVEVDVLSPAFMPNVFGNYMLRMPKDKYMYAGVMAGAITGTNGMGQQKQITSFLVGANAGLSFPIGETVRFGLSLGYRYSHISMPQDKAYLIPPDGNGNFAYYELSDFDLQYFVNSISIAVKL